MASRYDRIMESTKSWRLKMIRSKSCPPSWYSYSMIQPKSKKDRKRKTRFKKQEFYVNAFETGKSTGRDNCKCFSNVAGLLKELWYIIFGKTNLAFPEAVVRILEIICSLKTDCCNLLLCTCCKLYRD